MAALITLEQAKAHLRIDTCDQDVQVQFMADRATGIILDYIDKVAEAADWDEHTVSAPIQMSILHELTHLWEHRGDQQVEPAAGAVPSLPPTIVAMLARTRDSVFA